MIHFEALADAKKLTPKQLAKKYGEEEARWALWQIELRQRAKKKFGEIANEMLFEREALEQATQARVAQYHASRFPSDALVVDLTAGIGGDAYWLSQNCRVLGFELNEERADYARHNTSLSVRSVEIRVEDGLKWIGAHQTQYCWADPDRRSVTGKRLISPEDYQPNPTLLAEELRECKVAGIKLSPMLPDDYLRSLGGRVEFVSFGGECCEAVVWLGRDVEPGWGATLLTSSGEDFHSQNEVEEIAESPLAYLHDFDPAMVRAHAMGTLMPDASALGDSPGYLTSDTHTHSHGYRTYEVLHFGSADSKKLKEVLRKNHWRVFEVKQRGAALDPSRVMKDLKTEGDPVSLIAWRVGKSIRVAICRVLHPSL
jgi:hypothetical protein